MSLAENHDALLLDLDGTVHLGSQPIDHVSISLERAERLGCRLVFVTNNASRPPAEIAGFLSSIDVPAESANVLTSPQVAATLLAQRHPAGAEVLVVGAPWLEECVRTAGLMPARVAGERTVAVVQGHSPDTGWENLAEACIALRAGADWVACNVDTTLPSDRGLLPGNGAMVAALATATGLRPRVAGKPERPLLDEAVRQAAARRPLFVGDRIDTDIAGANTAGIPSLLVLTGVSDAAALLAARPPARPTYVAFDLRGLVEDTGAVALAPGPPSASAGGWSVAIASGTLELASRHSAATGVTVPRSDALDALAVLAAAAWSSGVVEVRPADPIAAHVLARCGLAAGRLGAAAIPGR